VAASREDPGAARGARGSARGAILAALRRARREPAPLPSHEGPWTAPPERALAFERALEGAGGRCLRAASEGLEPALEALPAYARAGRVYSRVPGLRRANVALESLADPRELAGLALAVLPGAFGVAESGAVWVEPAGAAERAALWLAEHLVLVVPKDALVDHLHAAYARLRFEAPGFGCFVAGPSKTADIEQALVVGAQGPRALTVVLR
jgi:L-lactate dehydrogenase complex protein LldG